MSWPGIRGGGTRAFRADLGSAPPPDSRIAAPFRASLAAGEAAHARWVCLCKIGDGSGLGMGWHRPADDWEARVVVTTCSSFRLGGAPPGASILVEGPRAIVRGFCKLLMGWEKYFWPGGDWNVLGKTSVSRK